MNPCVSSTALPSFVSATCSGWRPPRGGKMHGILSGPHSTNSATPTGREAPFPATISRPTLFNLTWVFFPLMEVSTQSGLFNPHGLRVGEEQFHKWKFGVPFPDSSGQTAHARGLLPSWKSKKTWISFNFTMLFYLCAFVH